MISFDGVKKNESLRRFIFLKIHFLVCGQQEKSMEADVDFDQSDDQAIPSLWAAAAMDGSTEVKSAGF